MYNFDNYFLVLTQIHNICNGAAIFELDHILIELKLLSDNWWLEKIRQTSVQDSILIYLFWPSFCGSETKF